MLHETIYQTLPRVALAWLACLASVALGQVASTSSGGTGSGKTVEISEAIAAPGGLLVHHVRSEYQAGQTEVRVLLPDRRAEGERLRVLYVLPVEAGGGTHWGSALEEVAAHDLHNKYGLVCVYPTFSHLPWYADHPTDPTIRQESYLIEVVLPLVEDRYPVRAEPEGRLLVGFSKSGWGAFSLLLRHPEVFGRAAAWDAPLDEKRPERYGMGPIFGGQENFEQYRIDRLLQRQAELLRQRPRLVLTGYGNFRAQHLACHELMTTLEIPHAWRDGPHREHNWHSGWLPEAVELLLHQ
jgi:S-formylglutathione hydrolase FrmB